MDSYLTVAETAKYLNTSERFVRRLIAERRIAERRIAERRIAERRIAERRIAFHHVGRHVRVALSDVDAWLTTQRVEPHQAASQTRRTWRRAS